MKNLILLTSTLFIFSCGGSEESDAPEVNPTTNENTESQDTVIVEKFVKVMNVNAEAFKDKLVEEQGVLVDVRTAEEYAAGHIEGAINIDFNSASFSDDIDTLNKSTPVFVYCQAGGRSGKARDMMIDQGFETIYNLEDGYSSWND